MADNKLSEVMSWIWTPLVVAVLCVGLFWKEFRMGTVEKKLREEYPQWDSMTDYQKREAYELDLRRETIRREENGTTYWDLLNEKD